MTMIQKAEKRKSIKRYRTLIAWMLIFSILTVFAGTDIVKAVDGDEAETETEGIQEGDWEYKLEDGKAVLLHYLGHEQELIIPDVVGGYSVVKVEIGCIAENQDVKKLTISSGIKELAGNAFADCSQLEEVTIPKDIETDCRGTVYGGPFAGCKNLKTVNFEDGIEVIPDKLFENCSGLDELPLPDTVTRIGDAAFASCSSLREIEIPDQITEIDMDAFFSCENLKKVTLGRGITKISEGTFRYCKQLQEVTIADGVTEIRDSAFWGCEKLGTVNIPPTVTKLGDAVFSFCTSLEQIILPDWIQEMGIGVFEQVSEQAIYVNEYSNTSRLLVESGQFFSLHTNENPSEKNGVFNYKLSDYYVGNANSGFVNLHLKYAVKAQEKDAAENLEAQIVIPASTIVRSLTLDGKALSEKQYTIEEIKWRGAAVRLTIPLEKSEGHIVVSVHPGVGSQMLSYADLVCRHEGKIKSELVHVLSSNDEVLTLETAERVTFQQGQTKVKTDIRGYGVPETSVRISLDGEEQVTTTTSKTGFYKAELTLENPRHYQPYDVEVCCHNGEEELKVEKSIQTMEGDPDVSEFKLHTYEHGEGRWYDLLSAKTNRMNVVYDPNYTYEFFINYADRTNINRVYVVSTKNGIEKTLEAKWDEKRKAYVTSGYFDNDRYYLPGVLTLKCEMREGIFDVDQETGEVSLSENNSNVKLLQEELFCNLSAAKYTISENHFFTDVKIEETSVRIKETGEEILSFDTVDRNIFDSDEELMNRIEEKVGRNKSTKKEVQKVITRSRQVDTAVKDYTQEKISEKEFITKVEDAGYIVEREKTNDGSDTGKPRALVGFEKVKDSTNGREDIFIKVCDVSKQKVGEFLVSQAKDALTEKMLPKVLGERVFKSMEGDINKINKIDEWSGYVLDLIQGVIGLYDEYTYVKDMEYAEQASKDPNLSPKEREQYKKEAKELRKKALKQAADVMITALGLISTALIGLLSPPAAIIIVLDLVVPIVIDVGMGILLGWILDPSGYIYSGVTGNRIGDATVSIYYKPTKDAKESLLWNAEEYEQSNPLQTDERGNYAWDVPEGYWQVKAEKDGYNTVTSDWLPVPPPQLGVNLNIISKEKPVIDRCNIYENFAIVHFSQYMSPETVKNLILKDAQGNPVSYSIAHRMDEKDSQGNIFANEYVLSFTEGILKVGEHAFVYSDTSVCNSVGISMLETQTEMVVQENEDLACDDYINIAYDDSIEFVVETDSNQPLSYKIDGTAYASIVDVKQENNKYTIQISGDCYGSAVLKLELPNTGVAKAVPITIGEMTSSGRYENTISFAKKNKKNQNTTDQNTVDTIPQVTTQKKSEKKESTASPSVPKMKKVKVCSLKKGLKISWKKGKVDGYEIRYSRKNRLKGAKKILLKKSKTTYKIKNLKKKKKYYVWIRAYINVEKKTAKAYGKWTKRKKKTK